MKKILVIGESCKDVFVYCDSSRLAPDLPVPIVQPKYIKENPGMAMNVFRNINALHKDCGIVTNSNWENVKKTRFVHERTNYLFLRVDENDFVEPFDRNNINYNCDIIVISDYNKNYLSCHDIEELCNSHPCVFLDTKKPLGMWAASAKYIKINNFEYNRSDPAVTKLLDNQIICTLGGDGARYQGVSYPTNYVDVRDSSGAGDSFLAALVVRYIDTSDIIQSIVDANIKASRIVAGRGVGIIS